MLHKHKLRLTSLFMLLFLTTLFASPWTQIGFARTAKPIPVGPVPVEDDAAVPQPTNPVVSPTKPPISGVVEEEAVQLEQAEPRIVEMQSAAGISSLRIYLYSTQRAKRISIRSDFSDVKKEMLLPMATAIANHKERLLSDDNYDVKSVRNYGEWQLLSIGLAEVPDEIKKDLQTGKITEWGSPMHSAIAKRDKKGTWEVALRGTQRYKELINQTPDEWMSTEAKAVFAQVDQSQESTTKSALVQAAQSVNYKLPWPSGVTWKLGNYGTVTIDGVTKKTPWHADGGGRNCNGLTHCALDFVIATSVAEERRLLSSANGVVTNICTKGTKTRNIDVEHADGTVFKYWHIDKNTYATGLNNNPTILRGTVLGQVLVGSFEYDGCGNATQTNAHVHWKLPADRAIVIDGISFMYEYGGNPGSGDISFTSSNNPVFVCPEPPSDATWQISATCYISGHVTVAQNHNVIIQNSSVVTITPSGRLDLNFLNHNLTIKSGSKLLIKNGGKVH